METIDVLLNKVSYPKLTDPIPSKEQMNLAYKAAFRAPDHGWLRPWRFIEITNNGREKLGKAFKNAAIKNGELDEEKLLKFEKLPFGPIISPNPGPTFDIDVAAADIEVVKSRPLVDKRAVIRKKITIYKNMNEMIDAKNFSSILLFSYFILNIPLG